MEIYVVRHTRPEIERGFCYGWTDIPVASTYDAELEVIRNELHNIQFDAVYSSPLIRCSLLAKDLNKGDIVFDDRLREVNFGDWELRKWDDIPLEESQAWMNDFVHVSPPNGESLLDMSLRVNSFLHTILHMNFKRVLICTHAGVIRCMNSSINEVPLDEIFTLSVYFGQIIKFTIKE